MQTGENYHRSSYFITLTCIHT